LNNTALPSCRLLFSHNFYQPTHNVLNVSVTFKSLNILIINVFLFNRLITIQYLNNFLILVPILCIVPTEAFTRGIEKTCYENSCKKLLSKFTNSGVSVQVTQKPCWAVVRENRYKVYSLYFEAEVASVSWRGELPLERKLSIILHLFRRRVHSAASSWLCLSIKSFICFGSRHLIYLVTLSKQPRHFLKILKFFLTV